MPTPRPERKSKKVTLEQLQEVWTILVDIRRDLKYLKAREVESSEVFQRLLSRTSATVVKQFAQTVNLSTED